VLTKLPTSGLNDHPIARISSNSAYVYATGIGSTPRTNGSNAENSTYNDYLAIWDAYNGAENGAGGNGTPSGWWSDNGFSTATPSGSEHSNVDLSNGIIPTAGYYQNGYVALQVTSV
jgi:hypothetical protein